MQKACCDCQTHGSTRGFPHRHCYLLVPLGIQRPLDCRTFCCCFSDLEHHIRVGCLSELCAVGSLGNSVFRHQILSTQQLYVQLPHAIRRRLARTLSPGLLPLTSYQLRGPHAAVHVMKGNQDMREGHEPAGIARM